MIKKTLLSMFLICNLTICMEQSQHSQNKFKMSNLVVNLRQLLDVARTHPPKTVLIGLNLPIIFRTLSSQVGVDFIDWRTYLPCCNKRNQVQIAKQPSICKESQNLVKIFCCCRHRKLK